MLPYFAELNDAGGSLLELWNEKGYRDGERNNIAKSFFDFLALETARRSPLAKVKWPRF
jgi:hypothetical protein